MGVGIFENAEEVLELPVIRCGAAKRETYGSGEEEQRRMTGAILQGLSLTLHVPKGTAKGIDPIGEIMADAQPLKATFGNEIRHFVFGAAHIDRHTITAAQTLTEKLTQSVLSVKAVGTGLPSEAYYQAKLRSRWIPETPRHCGPQESQATSQDAAPSRSQGYIDEIAKEVEETGVTAELDRAFPDEPGRASYDWTKWLEFPYTLPGLLRADATRGTTDESAGSQEEPPGGELRLPAKDIRVWPFFTVMGATKAHSTEDR
jgi:hypothetical protein